MEIKQTIGIDISKLTFDVKIHTNQQYKVFNNDNKGFKALLKWVTKNNPISQENTLFALEYTGMYSEQISKFFSDNKMNFVLIPGLEIKRSLGISRGKDDKVDAQKIALYAFRLRDEIKPSVMPSNTISMLKKLLSLRDKLVAQRAGHKTRLKEQKRVYSKKENKILFQIQESIINTLTKQINKIQKEIATVVESDHIIKEQHLLITSIIGVGDQTALNMIVTTNAFNNFKSWRKYASYCGIAPFPNSSGTSLRGKTKISHLANKKMKSLLDLCAKSALQYNPEIILYYNRRISDGKNKRSTINVIRNKLLARIFAVIKRKSPYIDLNKFAA